MEVSKMAYGARHCYLVLVLVQKKKIPNYLPGQHMREAPPGKQEIHHPQSMKRANIPSLLGYLCLLWPNGKINMVSHFSSGLRASCRCLPVYAPMISGTIDLEELHTWALLGWDLLLLVFQL